MFGFRSTKRKFKLNKHNDNMNKNMNDDKGKFEEKIELKGTENVGDNVVFEDTAKKQLIYGVSESPPIHVTIICGLQVKIKTGGRSLMLKYSVCPSHIASYCCSLKGENASGFKRRR